MKERIRAVGAVAEQPRFIGSCLACGFARRPYPSRGWAGIRRSEPRVNPGRRRRLTVARYSLLPLAAARVLARPLPGGLLCATGNKCPSGRPLAAGQAYPMGRGEARARACSLPPGDTLTDHAKREFCIIEGSEKPGKRDFC